MEIELKPEPVLVLNLDLNNFKKMLCSNLDLEAAVMKNLTIVSQVNEPLVDKLKAYVFLTLDWGRLILLYKKVQKSNMKITVYKAAIKNMIKYEPDKLDTTSNTIGIFTFNEQRIEQEDVFLITHDFLPMMEHHIEILLKENILDCEHKSWTPIRAFE